MRHARSLLTTTALALGATACGRATPPAPAAQTPAAIAVRSAAVTDTTLSRPIVAAGTVKPVDEVALAFKVGGVIATLRVDVGDEVHAGQTLATLVLDETDAAMTQSRAAAAKAERDLGRAQRLYADSVVTLAQVQDAETAAQVARAGVRATAINRRYAEIVAPFDGVVLARTADAGQIAGPGLPVLTLGSRGHGVIVRVAVADRDLFALHVGDAATVRFDALGGDVITGTVTRIAAAADPSTGTYAVDIGVRGGAALRSGMVGEADISPRRVLPTKLVPLAALLEADGAAGTVFALSADGQRAERRRVRLGAIDGERVAVLAGLDGVARVVTGGVSNLGDRSHVRVTP